MKLRIGTRGSVLARAQAADVARRLEALGHETETVVISTAGDRQTDRAFADVGSFGIFVREIEAALLDGRVDVAVHSYKDLPSRSPAGLVIAAVPERMDAADLLLTRPLAGDVSRGALPLRTGARVGTSAARRHALLRHLRPDLEVAQLRGNVPTRVRALGEGRFDAIVLAAAGVARLERMTDAMRPLVSAGIVRTRLDPELFVPAPAQGAIAVQVRADAAAVGDAVAEIDDPRTARALRAERAALALAEGGCTLPFGAWCREGAGGVLILVTVLGREDGSVARAEVTGDDPEAMAAESWRKLTTERGAKGQREGRSDGEGRGAKGESMNAGALLGRRILVTRAREDAERWAEALSRLGASPLVFPCLVSEPIGDVATAEALRAGMAAATWLVVTSVRGAEAVARLFGGPLPLRTRVVAVGPATARAALECFGRVDLVASVSTSEALGAELAALLRDAAAFERSVLVAGAAGGRQDAELGLTAAGITTRRVDVYRTTPVPPAAHKRELAADGVDDVLLASPSAVTGLVNCAVLPKDARVITIGPTTSAAATAAGLRVTAEAGRPDLDGMLEAMT